MAFDASTLIRRRARALGLAGTALGALLVGATPRAAAEGERPPRWGLSTAFGTGSADALLVFRQSTYSSLLLRDEEQRHPEARIYLAFDLGQH